MSPRTRPPVPSVLALMAFCGLALGSVARLAAEPVDLDSWVRLRSESFEVASNAEPERAAEVVAQLELFRRSFSLISPDLRLRSTAPTAIVVFRDEASYRPYRTVSDPRVLGQFLRRPDGNYLTLNAGHLEAGAFAVAYHEYVHYLLDANLPWAPRWFHEGLAEVYSTFAVDGDSVVLGGPIPRHLEWLRREAQRRERSFEGSLELAEIFHEEGRAHEGETAGGYYALSWALVHHLLDDEERLDRTATFLALTADGEAPEEAFERAFDTRLEDFESELYRRALSGELRESRWSLEALAGGYPGVEVSRMAPANVLYRLGDLLLQSGREAEALHHFDRALALDPEHGDALAGRAAVLDRESRFEEAEILHDDALAAGLHEARSFLHRGRHFLALVTHGRPDAGQRAKRAEAARRAFAKAITLDPTFAEARVLFGWAHLEGEVDPGPGIAAVEAAWGWLPARTDLPLLLIRLHLRNDAPEAARRVYRTAFSARPDEDPAPSAREEIERYTLLAAAQSALDDGEIDEGIRLLDEAVAVTTDPGLRQRLEERLVETQHRFGRR